MTLKFKFTYRKKISVFQMFGGLDWSKIADLLVGWNEGQEGYLTATKIGKLKSPEELAYYYAVILPYAFEAFKESGEFTKTVSARGKTYELPLDMQSADAFLKFRYGKWKGEYKDKGDMTMAECAAFMDFCILWLAEYYHCHIPPADPNWRERSK